jgi:hypothetical protein
MTPRRIQLSRKKGYRKPEGAIVVSRPGKWGNPFTVQGAIDAGYADTPAEGRAVAAAAFRDWLHGDTWAAGQSEEWEAKRLRFVRDLHLLAGTDLACWCPIGAPCHADALLEIASGVPVGWATT